MPRKKDATPTPNQTKKTPSLFTSDPLVLLTYVINDQTQEKKLAQIVKQRRGIDRASSMLKSKLSKSRALLTKKKISNEQNNIEATSTSATATATATATVTKPVPTTTTTTDPNHPENQENIDHQNDTETEPQRRIRFADHERPASAAAGRTRPRRAILKTPSKRKLQGNRPSSANNRASSARNQTTPNADGTYPLQSTQARLPQPNPHMSPAEILEMIQLAEDSRLNEELTTDVVGMLSPVQRQRYYSRPALNSRMRTNDYQVHRLNWAHPLRLNDAPRWDTSSTPLSMADFRSDRAKSLGGHRPRVRSSALRRYHTGKAIVNYNSVVGKQNLPISEMKKSWNRVTKPTTFHAATIAVKGERKKYGYGTRVTPHGGYDIGRTLSYSDELGVLINRNESNLDRVTEEKKDAKIMRRKGVARNNQRRNNRHRHPHPQQQIGTTNTTTNNNTNNTNNTNNNSKTKHVKQYRAQQSIISSRTSHRHPRYDGENMRSGFHVSEDNHDKVIYSIEYMEKRAERRDRKRRERRERN